MATDVKWIKIVTNIFDDEKILLIESMPEADSIIVIWFKLLCMAGKQNNKGIFAQVDQKVGKHHRDGVGVVGDAGHQLAHGDVVQLLVRE